MIRRFSCLAARRAAAATLLSTVVRSGARSVRMGGAPPPTMGGRPPLQGMPEEPVDDAEPEEPRGPTPKPEGQPKFFQYDIDQEGVCVLTLNRAPVNSLSLEAFEEITQWMMWMGDAEEVKGLILTSAIPSVYSAGLDISELFQPKEDRFPVFWSAFQHFFITLHTFPKPIIAAINGNAPAGGCIIALGCDYRVMAKHPKDKEARPFRIGLNETKLGLIAPPWVMSSMSYVVGRRRAEKMLQLGETPTADEALQIGLVDEVCAEEAVLPQARAALKKFMGVSNQARWLTRDMMRGEIMFNLSDRDAQEHDIQFFANMVSNPDVQKHLGDYLARLRGGKK